MRKQRIFTVMIGQQRCGKSTLAKNLIFSATQPVLVYDNPDDATLGALPVIRDLGKFYAKGFVLSPEKLGKGDYVSYRRSDGLLIQGQILTKTKSQVIIANVFDKGKGGQLEATVTDPGQGTYFIDKFRVSYQVPYAEFLSFLKAHVRNSLVVVTDATSKEVNQLSKELRALMYELTHYGLDLLMCFHNNFRIPIEVIEMCHYIVKFKEGGPLSDRFKDRLNPKLYTKLQRVWTQVENRPIKSLTDNYYNQTIEVHTPLDAIKNL